MEEVELVGILHQEMEEVKESIEKLKEVPKIDLLRLYCFCLGELGHKCVVKNGKVVQVI